jgi:hypothetical protein
MKIAALAPVLAVLSIVVLAAPQEVPAGAREQAAARLVPPCPNPLPHEPLVVYEVTGGTFAGPFDLLLVVYSDGLARYSSNLGAGPGLSFTQDVGAAAAQELADALVAAGAMRQCDLPDFAVDVPLSTLTVLRGTARQRANSFSWFVAEGEVAVIEALLLAFLANDIPQAPARGS